MSIRRIFKVVLLAAAPAAILFWALRHVEDEFPGHRKFVDADGIHAVRDAAEQVGIEVEPATPR